MKDLFEDGSYEVEKHELVKVQHEEECSYYAVVKDNEIDTDCVV